MTIIQQLSTLTCFNKIETIKPIIIGLSSQCYQVNADNNKFFAKKLTTTSESTISVDAALENISPEVIYYDQQWLITEFIDSNDLSSCSQHIDEKISIAIKLMAKCHQLKTSSVEFLPKEAALTLINKTHFSVSQQNELKQIVNQLTSPLINSTPLVCCHGDLNFSNILFSSKSEALLVDYECACTGPAEYDIAMFIAVNNLSRDKLTTIIESYEYHSGVGINQTRLNHHLLLCYFINSLWYIDAYHRTGLSKLLHLAKQQWKNGHLGNIKIF